jgi:hypothetical protein
MMLDDTKDTIYIHDLEKELAEIEAEEQDIAFIPEIEKKLTAIPKSVLRDRKPANNELVLYRLPASLTVPEDKDSVRRAVADARRRARDAESHHGLASATKSNTEAEGPLANSHLATHDIDSGSIDAMDIDDR